jgi:hypothetical protein
MCTENTESFRAIPKEPFIIIITSSLNTKLKRKKPRRKTKFKMGTAG